LTSRVGLSRFCWPTADTSSIARGGCRYSVNKSPNRIALQTTDNQNSLT
jgi:hypothetical protein